jgi:hypothetical protein
MRPVVEQHEVVRRNRHADRAELSVDPCEPREEARLRADRLQLLAPTHGRLGTIVLIHYRVGDRCTDARELGVIQLTPDEVIDGLCGEGDEVTRAAPPRAHARSIGCTTPPGEQGRRARAFKDVHWGVSEVGAGQARGRARSRPPSMGEGVFHAGFGGPRVPRVPTHQRRPRDRPGRTPARDQGSGSDTRASWSRWTAAAGSRGSRERSARALTRCSARRSRDRFGARNGSLTRVRTSEGYELQPPKLVVRVRFPSPAPLVRARFRRSSLEWHPLDARHDFPSQCPPPGVVAPAAAALDLWPKSSVPA